MSVPKASPKGLIVIWTSLRHFRWHQWARVIAAMVLADQALGPITSIPSSEAIIVACIGALFAPIPTEKK